MIGSDPICLCRRDRNMPKIGETVRYGQSGLCKVEGTCEKEIAGEKRGFFAPRAGPHFKDGVAAVQRIGREEPGENGTFRGRDFAFETRDFILRQFTEIRVTQKRPVPVKILQQLD